MTTFTIHEAKTNLSQLIVRGLTGEEIVIAYLANYELRQLPITVAHAQLGGLRPCLHKDPFDRILGAQARLEGIPIVTSDHALREFGIEILW